MTLTITVCAEDSLAADVAGLLLDRIVTERASEGWLRDLWSDPTARETQRHFVDFDGGDGWSDRTHLRVVESRSRRRVHPRRPDTNRALTGSAALSYKCVRLAAALPLEERRVLLLAFDADGKLDEQRCRTGVEAARHHTHVPLAVVIAEAQPEFDAWVITGFVPANARDREAAAEIRASFRDAKRGFDPIAEAHRLTSTVKNDPCDAKKLCQQLLGLAQQAHAGDPAVLRCIDSLPLDIPTAGPLGLAAFVEDVLREVLPRLGDRPPSVPPVPGR